MSSLDASLNELERAWEQKPDVIKAFLEVRPNYEQLCSEVEYILKKRMDSALIEYSAVSSRAKTLKSFAEKLSRKQYEDALTNVTDLAGVRLVYLYKSDRSAIGNIIESEFKIVEKLDKIDEQESDKFGYGALHYLVKLGRKSSGARYDDLKDLICEIQVRTVLQDAWAIIDHHLSYKQESDVPKFLKRKLNSVSGLFETADDQFDRIRAEREQYTRDIKSKLGSPKHSLAQDLNLDTFIEFLKWKFPRMGLSSGDPYNSKILSQVTSLGYARLEDLSRLLDNTASARDAINSERPTASAVGQAALALALIHPEVTETKGWESWTTLVDKYRHLAES